MFVFVSGTMKKKKKKRFGGLKRKFIKKYHSHAALKIKQSTEIRIMIDAELQR